MTRTLGGVQTRASLAYDMRRKKDWEECVYFIDGECANSLIKIGRTVKIIQRIKALQACSPVRLRLLGIIKTSTRWYADGSYSGGSKELERELHKRFSHLHEYLEWFRPGEDLRQYILEEVKK